MKSLAVATRFFLFDYRALGIVLLSLLWTGCGGQPSTPAPTAQTQSVVFFSSAALNGSNASGAQNIWTMHGDGSSIAPLTGLTVPFSSFPAWSPDGTKITFESSRSLDGSDNTNSNGVMNVWVMNADGSGIAPLTKLTATSVFADGAFFSPDMQKVVFSSNRALDGSDALNANGTVNVWIENADGSGATPLTALTANGAFTAVAGWSPDGKKIILQSQRALDGSDAQNTNGTFNIWLVNPDGTGLVPLTTLTANAASSTGARFIGAAKLAFASARALDGSDAANTNNVQNIWTMNADGSGAVPVTRLTAAGVDLFTFEFSPDGSKVAFTSSRALDGTDVVNTNGVHNLWVMNADGSNPTPLTRLTAAGAEVFSVFWSPDGSRLTFDSARALDGSDAANLNGTSNIWSINSDGASSTPLTRITANAASSFGPEWKP